MPSAALTDDDDISVESDDDRIMSSYGPCCGSPEGANKVVVPPPWRSEIFKVPTHPPPPQRFTRLRGKEAPTVNLASHPECALCNKSLVTDRMRDNGFIQANKAQFIFTLGT